MHSVRIGLGFAVTVLLAALLLRYVDLRQVAHDLLSLGPTTLAASMGLVLVGYSLRAWRWQITLRGTGVDTNYRQVAPLFFAGFALNNVLPLRAGDGYRCVIAARLPEGNLARSLATLLTKRLLDIIILTILVCALALMIPHGSLSFVSLPLAVGLAVGCGLAVLLIVAPVSTCRFADRVLGRSLARFRATASAAIWLQALSAAVEDTLSGGVRMQAVGLTGVAWLLELGVFVLIGSIMSGKLLFAAGFFAGTAGTLATLIPSSPGHLGTFDFFAAQGFHYGGVSAETAVAAAVASHLLILVPVTAIGAFRLIADRQAGLNASG